ncbi:basement membrane-specific heparan sulfate proteoglycan core protein-like [Sphaeramia orbicularis]|uniref:basement membrane-specific heparan sulfate proteoglycan core protein-like n=1 Tax=Sphaeramia orbicularis TaxID=375764 RepID=UPI0011803366|nr:basement membrane-specific heparan sulfate proteoglycan core protein-like [Sphaeramia orbicularis]
MGFYRKEVKGAAMSLTAVSGFIIFCLTVQVGQTGWSVTYSRTQICAVKGSTVTIGCSYSYPWGAKTIQKIWFTKGSNTEPVDLLRDRDYNNRVKYSYPNEDCTLTITNVKESDSAEYKFRFVTDRQDGRYTGSPGVTLSVTDPRVQVSQSEYYQNPKTLSCEASCVLPKNPSYIWYKNEEKQSRTGRDINVWDSSTTDSYSCAIQEHEDFPSPPVCVVGHTCKRVTYTKRSICAPAGSTVDISCTYNSGDQSITSAFWFRNQEHYYPQPQDLSGDSRYTGRARVFQTQQGQSTLRIIDLRNSDSAQYRFKFTTPSLEWRSSLPGTTLTVTGITVQITPSSAVGPVLQCQTNCPVSDASSYVWYKNGKQIDGERSFLYPGTSDSNNYIDSFSCALKGHEDFPANSVCINGRFCLRVNYNQRSICAHKGSTVDISCTYSGYSFITSEFWFRNQQHYYPQPQDLSGDSRYTVHVQDFQTQRHSTLKITDLRENDSAQYRFKFRTSSFEWNSSLPGTTLTVTALQVQVIRLEVERSQTRVELRCLSSCLPTGHLYYVWFINGQKQSAQYSFSYKRLSSPGENISCAFLRYENNRSPSVYAPKGVLVSKNTSDEIREGSPVTLTCSSDANPAPNYTISRRNVNLSLESVHQGPDLVFRSIQSSDSGEYYCVAENELGRATSSHIVIDVKYPPKSSSISVSSTGNIAEGDSVTLTCTSDAKPKAHHTLNKGNQTLPLQPGGIYYFTSISPEDTGVYYCTSNNTYGQANSSSHFLDVQYPPRIPSMSVSPSGHIVEGSSVTLTCSGDANPAARYTWYKEDEDSPVVSGQVHTIAEFGQEHSGNYYCEAENSRGHNRSVSHQVVLASSMKTATAVSVTCVTLFVIPLAVLLYMRRKRSSKQPAVIRQERPDKKEQPDTGDVHVTPATQEDDLCYSTVAFTKNKNEEDPLYSNIGTVQLHRRREEDEEEENVEYSVVNLKSDSATTGLEEAEEDPSTLYSTVNKIQKNRNMD